MTDATKNKISQTKTEYKDRYCRKIVEYFYSGCTERNSKGCLNSIPSYVGFARKIGVTSRTIENWRKKYEEFGEACEECDAMLKETIIGDGLTYHMHANFAKFLLSARYGMREKVEITHDGEEEEVKLTPEVAELLKLRKERQDESKS